MRSRTSALLDGAIASLAARWRRARTPTCAGACRRVRSHPAQLPCERHRVRRRAWRSAESRSKSNHSSGSSKRAGNVVLNSWPQLRVETSAHGTRWPDSRRTCANGNALPDRRSMASRSASTRASLGPHSCPCGAGSAVAAHRRQKTHEKHAHVDTGSSTTSSSVRPHREHITARSVPVAIDGGKSAARCDGRHTRPLATSTAPKARASAHDPTMSTGDAAPSFATSTRFWSKERRRSSASARSGVEAHAASPTSRSAATTLRGKRQRSASCSRAMESMTVSGTPAAARRARISTVGSGLACGGRRAPRQRRGRA